jgi:hypothetical protein
MNTKLCKLKYLNDKLKPMKNQVIISCSIFKLHDMYRDASIYINGLVRIIKYVNKKPLLFLRVYYDHSIENDKEFNILLSIYGDTIQFVKYYCESFIGDNTLHRGVFGTFVRFLPLFDKTLKNHIRFVSDIDYNKNEVRAWLKYYLKKILKTNNNITLVQRIGYEWKYAKKYMNKTLNGTVLANIYIKNIYAPIELFENSLEKLRDNNYKLVNMIKEMMIGRTKLGNGEDIKYTQTNSTFTYGIDEWFINCELLPCIFKNEKVINIIYMADALRIYPKEMFNKNSNLSKIYKKMHVKNLHELSTKFAFWKIKTIKDYKKLLKNIKIFYDYIVDSNILLTDKSWLSNLKKHIKNNFIFHDLFIEGTIPIEVYKYVMHNFTIKAITI